MKSRNLSLSILLACAFIACRNAVDSDPLVRIELLTPESPMGVGESGLVLANLLRADGELIGDRGVVWTSSDPLIASITATEPRQASLAALSPGNATITATAGDKTASVEIAVIVRVPRPDIHATLWTPQESAVDLGVLPGTVKSIAMAINDSGQVVGWGSTDSCTKPFLWTAGNGMTELAGWPADQCGFPTDINNAGQVVGYRGTPDGTRSFVWTATGGILDIGTLPGATWAMARAINDSGEVVGNSGGMPFRWTAARGMEKLPVLPTATGAIGQAINNLGQIVGQSGNGYDPAQMGVIWEPDGSVTEVACCGASATGINASGQAVGVLFGGSSGIRSFIWTRGGGSSELTPPPGMAGAWAKAINDSGQVTGSLREGIFDRAFIWTQATGIRDIGFVPGRENCFGNAINNRGQVVGFCD